ncbi:MAG TPA: DUF6527 family protein [Gaiellales bacterium]|nr:DUF6527 family protein [Gaiellales bacterium]
MRLTELEPQFVRAELTRVLPTDPWRETMLYVGTLAEAQGVLFDCPTRGCSHRILVWFSDRGVPPECTPSPRWAASGSGYDDLTLAPSIDISRDKEGRPMFCEGGRPGWHGFITNGEVAP